jgi:glucose/arabinose dehydrogenase
MRMTRRALPTASVALVLSIAGLAGCSSDEPAPERSASPSSSAPSSASPSSSPNENKSAQPVSVGDPEEVVSGLEVPWSIVFVDQTPIFSERDTGRIREIGEDGSTRLVGQVEGVEHLGGEGGLLGLAVDEQHRLYAYSSSEAGNRVQRYELSGAPGSYRLGSPTTIIDDLPQSVYHNGGRIAIGPDGMLYVAVGDTQDSDTAQDRKSLGGKILRMTLDGEVPDDNPFDGSFVYSYGHRNVQGMAWTSDGTMFASEFGENTWDELNVIEAGGNYGWPEVEGIGRDDRFIDPVQQWEPADASPSGIAVVDDQVFIANLRGEVLRQVPASDPGESTEHFNGDYGRLRAVAPAPDGSLWLITNNTDGVGAPRDGDDRILRIPLQR